MIGCIRRTLLGLLAALWHVDQCELCAHPITGEPLVDHHGRLLCEACIWVGFELSSSSLHQAGAGTQPDGTAPPVAPSGSFFASPDAPTDQETR